MKALWGFATALVFALGIIAVPATAQYSPENYDAGTIENLPELRRLIAQANPQGQPAPYTLELYGHILSRQRSEIAGDPVAQARFAAIVDYLARFARSQDGFNNTGRATLDAFQRGLNGESQTFAGRPVYSIYSDAPHQPAGPGAPAEPADLPGHKLMGQYTKQEPCLVGGPMTTTVQVREESVLIEVSNWACRDENWSIRIEAKGGVFQQNPQDPNIASLGTNPSGGVHGQVSGTVHKLTTGEQFAITGDYWLFQTRDMQNFQLYCPMSHDVAIQTYFP